jgi:hypothetical protein
VERKEYIFDIQWKTTNFDDAEARKQFQDFMKRMKAEFPIPGAEVRIRRIQHGKPPVTVETEKI